MFPLPAPGTGKFVIARGQLRIGDGFRTLGQEVPEAFEWPASALHAHLSQGTLAFHPHPPFDTDFPRALLERFSARELRDLCEELELDPKGKKEELVLRLLQKHGFAAPDAPAPMIVSPPAAAPEVPAAPSSAPSEGTTPPPEDASPADVLRSMSVHELRVNVAPIYGVSTNPGDERDTLLEKILVAAGLKPGSAPSIPSPAPEASTPATTATPAASAAPAPAPEVPAAPAPSSAPSDVPPLAGGLAID